MRNPKNREMMAELYRLYERYEEPREDEEYWQALADECNGLCAKWGSPVLTCLCGGLMDGLAELRRQEEPV